MPSAPWWTLPYQAYTYQTKNKLGGILGKIHEAIDPVKAWGGYGGVLGAAMMGPGLNQRLPSRPMKFEDMGGAPVKVLVNPSQRAAGRLVMGAKEGMARAFGDNAGNLFMWSGDDAFTHADLMKQMGIPYTSDNYAGAGTVIGVGDAMDWAQRFGGR